MRIGLFTDAYFPIISGVSISVDTLANELRKLGHEVYIITNKHERAVQQEYVVRLGGYKMPMKGMHDFRVGKVTRKKVQAVRDLHLDIVHCHTEFTMGRLGRKAAKKIGIPIVHTYHTMYEAYVHYISKALAGPLRFGSKIYSRNFANSADFVVFPTQKVQRTFESYGFNRKAHIIPTGIYLERFRKMNFKNADLAQLKASLGLAKDDFVLLYLGRLSREKSITSLIEQFSKINRENVHLVLVGDGPDRPAFIDAADKLGVGHRVHFTGMIDPKDVGKYYQLADLFVNFSVTETQGLTYIEALSSGIPVLVKYDDNLEDVVENGYNGFTFEQDDEFVGLFETIYNDKTLQNQLKSNANKAIEKYSAQTYAKKIEAIYKQIH